ncbi:MAG TPA: hypothetical protein VNH83_14795, partial [Bryobacteraceae bacterium]|nr:hypothetical protein [Bryobacteraceae bacterium]
MRKAVVAVLVLTGVILVADESGVFALLKSNVRIGRQGDGVYLLPTNQLLHPWGEQAAIKGRPVDLTFDSRKHLLAVLNSRNVLLMDGTSGARMAEARAHTSYAGIAFRPGDRELWASETGEERGSDALLILQLSELGAVTKTERMPLPKHPVPVGIGFSADGKTAYVAFSRSNTLAVIDADERKVKRQVIVGVAPFGVAVSRTHVFVTNR